MNVAQGTAAASFFYCGCFMEWVKKDKADGLLAWLQAMCPM
jgi:hypothetical protein